MARATQEPNWSSVNPTHDPNKGKIITEGTPRDLIAKFDSDKAEKGNLENVFLHLTGRDLRD